MVISGNTTLAEVKRLSEKWFAPIPAQEVKVRNLPKEPVQTEERKLTVESNVPATAIYKAYHMCDKLNDAYYATDLLSDTLSNGRSARLYNELVKEQKLFSEINAYVTGDIDAGLFIVSGKLAEGVSIEKAEQAIEQELERIKNTLINDSELQKVKNKIESTLVFTEMNILNKAMNLAYAELMGDAGRINSEADRYNSVTTQAIQTVANTLFKKENCSTLYYLAKHN